MKILSINKSSQIAALICLGFLQIILVIYLQNPIVNTVITIFYFIFHGAILARNRFKEENKLVKLFWGNAFLISLIIFAWSGVYWFWGYSSSFVFFTIPLVTVFTILISKFETLTIKLKITKPNLKILILTLLLLALYIALFGVLQSRQTSDTFISPWIFVGPKFFLIYFVATALLFYILQTSKNIYKNLFLLVIHFFLSLSIINFLFTYAFGFDGVIHQASTKKILETGVIEPKQPYYIGQYMLVLFLQKLTGLSIEFLNKILVPLLAGLSLPIILIKALKNRVKNVYPILATLLIPLSFFTFTTPNNLALLFALAVFGGIFYQKEKLTKETIILYYSLALASTAIHPLIGLPTIIIYTAFIFYKKKLVKNYLLKNISYALSLALVLPAALYLNSLRAAESIVLHNPLERLENFVIIFSPPHWYIFSGAPTKWQLLYAYIIAFKFVIVFAMLAGVWLYEKGSETHKNFIFTTIGSLFLSAFLLATTFEFPSVISYEQNVYAQRVLQILFVFLIPYFVFFVYKFFAKTKLNKILLSIILGFFVLISFYFTYPTRDPISLHTGYQIRSADEVAIELINSRNDYDPSKYIVLTNQVVSVAAINKLGFAHYHQTSDGPQFFYSIPTGGPLYQYFRKMVYEEPRKKWMVEAMEYADVKKAYFIHTNYWAPAAEIRDAAKLEADNWWELAGGRVWVYEYVLE